MSIERRLRQGPLRVRTLWDEEKTKRLPSLVLARRRRNFLLRSGALAAAVAAGAALLMLRFPPAAGTLTSVASSGESSSLPSSHESAELGSKAMPAPAERSLALADGSKIHLDKDAELSVERDESRLVQASLIRGGASFSVVPNAKREFSVRAGLVLVRVIGTKFELQRKGASTHVKVKEGHVRVSWPGGRADLRADESGWFPPEPEDSAEQPKPLRALPATSIESAMKTERDAPAQADWRSLAQARDYSKAFRAMKQEPDSVRLNPADLMLAADVARLSGHPQEAVKLLARVASSFPEDARAPLAEFTRGRLLVESLGQPSAAAEAFARARALSPSGSLAADALSREVDVRQQAAQSSQARALARLYLKKYPRGRHRAKCEQLASEQK